MEVIALRRSITKSLMDRTIHRKSSYAREMFLLWWVKRPLSAASSTFPWLYCGPELGLCEWGGGWKALRAILIA